MRKVITIDGPSGVGKGTIALMLAREHGWAYLDSGALYRLAALEVARCGLQSAEVEVQARAVAQMRIEFVLQDDGVTATLNGEAVGGALRLETTGQLASQLAANPEIRAVLLEVQRQFAKGDTLVADGRDMGTVVFPDAAVKIFLDASVEIRAERRYKQLKAKGEDVTLAALEKEIAERDQRDRNRKVAPLKPASDAVVIDTTERSVNEVLQQVKTLL